ncbi:MAG: hypothetical protein ACRDP1_10800 [Nocardioidaceae bacterium]
MTGVVEPEGQATSRQLRAPLDAEWARATSHPLIGGVADGSLDDAAFGRWLTINLDFLRTYRRFLIAMGTLSPDARGSRLMFEGVRGLDREVRDANHWLTGRDIRADGQPSPAAMDYTSYCMAALGAGWSRGVCVAYGFESVYYDAWSHGLETAVPGGRFGRFLESWGGVDSMLFVSRLEVLVDKVPWALDLSRTFGRVVRLEINAWDEAMRGPAQ